MRSVYPSPRLTRTGSDNDVIAHIPVSTAATAKTTAVASPVRERRKEPVGHDDGSISGVAASSKAAPVPRLIRDWVAGVATVEVTAEVSSFFGDRVSTKTDGRSDAATTSAVDQFGS
jgi:hypothetical protein